MKFDIEREKRTPSYYHMMKAEDLAFHDALHRFVVSLREKDKYISYHSSWKKHNRNIYPYVNVTEEGKIEVGVDWYFKNEKAYLKKADIEACMNVVFEFMEAAFEHGYLLKEDET